MAASISWPLLFWSGLVAYITTSWVTVLFRALRATLYSPRLYWASKAFGNTRGGAMFASRIMRAVALTVLVPIPYAIVFEVVGNAELLFGALLGLLHAILIGLTLPLATDSSGSRGAPAPGLFGWRLGAATPFIILFVYSFYGAMLGYVYVIPTP